MTNDLTSFGTSPRADNRRDWSVHQANQRGELLGELFNLLELSKGVCHDARKVSTSPEDFCQTVERIHSLLQELLAFLEHAPDPDHDAFGSHFHHDVRGYLANIIGYCELLCDEANPPVARPFEDDLGKIRQMAQELVESIDKISRYSKTLQTPGERNDPSDICPEVGVIPPTLEDDCRLAVSVTGTVLVVDDRETNRDLLRRRLERDGHTVTTASNGRKALQLLRSQPFDLVLLDLMMPDLSGWQVLEQLKADRHLRCLPVIMISALNELHSAVRCIEIGADDFLVRPVNPILLRARINACLEKKRLRDQEASYLKQIEAAEKRANELLNAVLPEMIVKQFKGVDRPRPCRHENVAVLFADIVNFTSYCDNHDPEEVVRYLGELVSVWEKSALEHRVQKIKTIGDAFMAASGLLEKVDNPVLSCVQFGLDMIAAVQQLPTEWDLRVGIHYGPLVAGVIGSRQFLYDLWGDTVNTAARMESHGVAGSITLSMEAWKQIASVSRGWERMVEVKGKGRLLTMRFSAFTT
jgi:adenylate cyclase